MQENIRKIAIASGDGGTDKGMRLTLRYLFPEYPYEEVKLNVESRIKSQDACMGNAYNAFFNLRSGFKNSTASKDPRIKEAKLGSVNPKMREKMKAFGMLRFLDGPGKYKTPCGVMRFGSGGIYGEKSCTIENIDGVETIVIVQHAIMPYLRQFAKTAMEIAKEKNLHLVLVSKPTISDSELLFTGTIKKIWNEAGLTQGDETLQTETAWHGDYHEELTDVALARLPINNIDNKKYTKGGFLMVLDNANGDTGSDIMEFQHGRGMSSVVYCLDDNSEVFTYQELPGGTADRFVSIEKLSGPDFFDPTGIIYALCAAYQQVNPQLKGHFDKIREFTIKYLERTPAEDRDTETMLKHIAQHVGIKAEEFA